MANSRAKENGEKIAALLKAWKELRPTKSFAKMTLEEFTAKVQPSLDARGTLDSLGERTTVALVERDTADVESIVQVELVVNAVKGDPDEGEDGEFYAAIGYVRKSDRKSGLTRKKQTPPTPPAP